MEAPDKLYISEGIYNTFMYQVPDPDDKTQIEYVRGDVVIKDACEWIKKNRKNYSSNALGEEYFIEDFKNYMKGLGYESK